MNAKDDLVTALAGGEPWTKVHTDDKLLEFALRDFGRNRSEIDDAINAVLQLRHDLKTADKLK